MSEFIEKIPATIMPWLLNHGLKILIIVIAALAVRKFGALFIEKLVRRVIVSNRFLSRESEKKREDTLIHIFSATLGVLVWIIGGLLVLQEAGFETSPFLAAVGVVGVALGFGGQYLIKDIISGLFIIIENQYRINDWVSFDGTSGTVEKISLRMTTLRDLDGVVHHVPHGEIKKVSNLSKHFARVNLNIGISYNTNLEHVIEVVNRIGKELAEDPAWKPLIIKAPYFLRVEDFADSAVIIKILGDTKPLRQWDVTGELRKRLKIAFDKEGIEIPFSQVVVHQAK